jgi:hypothetical protein
MSWEEDDSMKLGFSLDNLKRVFDENDRLKTENEKLIKNIELSRLDIKAWNS